MEFYQVPDEWQEFFLGYKEILPDDIFIARVDFKVPTLDRNTIVLGEPSGSHVENRITYFPLDLELYLLRFPEGFKVEILKDYDTPIAYKIDNNIFIPVVPSEPFEKVKLLIDFVIRYFYLKEEKRTLPTISRIKQEISTIQNSINLYSSRIMRMLTQLKIKQDLLEELEKNTVLEENEYFEMVDEGTYILLKTKEPITYGGLSWGTYTVKHNFENVTIIPSNELHPYFGDMSILPPSVLDLCVKLLSVCSYNEFYTLLKKLVTHYEKLSAKRPVEDFLYDLNGDKFIDFMVEKTRSTLWRDQLEKDVKSAVITKIDLPYFYGVINDGELSRKFKFRC